MSRQLPDAVTPVGLPELLVAYHGVWLHRLRGSPPPLVAIQILAAQWAIETWWGKACHCYNLGNAKCKPGGAYDWTFFKCGEELLASVAKRAAADSRVTIVREYVLGGRAFASVNIVPEHPWACFRAFCSLYEGAVDHLELLHRRFGDAFDAAQAGDPREFCACLKRRGYYTAPVDQYTKGVVGCLPRIRLASEQIEWDELPALTDWQVAQVEGIVALGAELDADAWAAMRAERDAAVTGE